MVDKKTYVEKHLYHYNHSMMNLDNYYLHATGGVLGQYNSEQKILNILDDGKISVAKEKKYNQSPLQSVCLIDIRKHDPRSRSNFSSAFDLFALYSPCLLFSRDLVVNIPRISRNSKGNDLVSDMEAEVRYKGDLSLDELEAITIPIYPNYQRFIIGNKKIIGHLELFKDTIKEIEKREIGVPVLDMFTGKIATCEAIDYQLSYYKKRCK